MTDLPEQADERCGFSGTYAEHRAMGCCSAAVDASSVRPVERVPSEEELNEIQARYSDWYGRGYDNEPLTVEDLDPYPDCDYGDEDRSHYIVRNDVPRLVEAVRVLRAENERLRTGGFYEDDEPVEDVVAAFDAGSKCPTGNYPTGGYQITGSVSTSTGNSEVAALRAENERLTERVDSVIGMVEPWPCECREDTWNGEPIMQTCLRCAVLKAARPATQTEEIF